MSFSPLIGMGHASPQLLCFLSKLLHSSSHFSWTPVPRRWGSSYLCLRTSPEATCNLLGRGGGYQQGPVFPRLLLQKQSLCLGGVEGRRNGNRIFKKLRQGIITWRIPPRLKPQTGVPDFRPTTTPVVKGLYVSRTPLRVSWFGGSLKAASSSTS